MSCVSQLWAGMQYSLRAYAADMKSLEKGLGSSDYKLIGQLGVARTIKKD